MGDGGTKEGVNEGNTECPYDDLERIHMEPYVDCISQGVSTVMASYSSWNGTKLHAHRYLLKDILKDKLGFKVNLKVFYLDFVWQRIAFLTLLSLSIIVI